MNVMANGRMFIFQKDRKNGTSGLSACRFKNFILLLNKKAEEGFRELLIPLQPLPLTPLNKKIFDFQGSPYGFSLPSKSAHR